MKKGPTFSSPTQYPNLRKLARTDPTIKRPSIPSAQTHAQVVEVMIPDGFAPGDMMQLAWGSCSFQVEVPSTCSSGDILRVTVPLEDDAATEPDDDTAEAVPEGCDAFAEVPIETEGICAAEEEREDELRKDEPHCCHGRMYINAADHPSSCIVVDRAPSESQGQKQAR